MTARALALTIAGGLAVLGVAVGLRLPQLERRPMHADEAVHTIKFAELWEHGRYLYDPHEYHGPTPYYSTLPVVWLTGASDFLATSATTYRLVPVLYGLLLVLLVALLRDGLGPAGTPVAALLIAVSPALTYYSRYYIPEPLLIAYAALALGATWWYLRTGRATWACVAGAALGAMHGTKSTCLLLWFAAAISAVVVLYWRRSGEWHLRRHLGPLMLALFVALLVSTALLSGGFTNLRGPLDGWLTYATYFERAGDGGHRQAWAYYLRLLLWFREPGGPIFSELLIALLAVVGAFAACRSTTAPGLHLGLARFLALYALLLTALYSAIPYKTPWNALPFLHAWILLAGVGWAALWHFARRSPIGRPALLLLLGLGVGQLGAQAWRTSHHPVFHNDPRNPWVYAPTVADAGRLALRLTQLHAAAPAQSPPSIQVIAHNPWPLPWYLRALPRVGYWDTPPPDLSGEVLVVGISEQGTLAERLRGCEDDYVASHYGLRRDEVLLVLVRRPLWESWLASQTAVSP
ncbi:MAG: TIGR03663 family protein [Phycisphaerales bacterium]|nr:TIGR03663 family protein [Phycisphaerales bacterium]